MATAYRSSASVINATAGTTVVVAKPAGLVDTGTVTGSHDYLVAFIVAAGAPSITPPAGWTLINTTASGTALTIWAYRKLATSEGANWTWTLGTSLRNWGWVGAYTGVDPTTPVNASGTDNTLTTSTVLTTSSASVLGHGQAIAAAAAVRAATGTGTTWTHTSTERTDHTTNAGAGVDICGTIGDTQSASDFAAGYLPTMTASQAQTDGVALSVTLNPYFVPYDGGHLGVIAQAALGFDPDGDLGTPGIWTDFTALLSQAPVSMRFGRPDGTSTADPALISFTVLNVNGEWTKPGGAYTQYLKLNLPFRFGITGIGFNATGFTHRGTALLASAKPRWDPTLGMSVVDIVAQGRLRRALGKNRQQPARSSIYRTISNSPAANLQPQAYWPFEDGSTSTDAVSAIAGHPLADTDAVAFATSAIVVGSASLATLSAVSGISATVPDYPATAQWTVAWVTSIPTEPAAQTTLMTVFTAGTAQQWIVSLVPGTTSLQLDVIDTNGVSLLSVGVSPNEASFYGKPNLITLSASINGIGLDYLLFYENATDNGGHTGSILVATAGQVTRWTVQQQPGLAGTTFGHWVLYSGPPAAVGLAPSLITQLFNAANGRPGEVPWSRFQRLAIEDGIPYTMTPSSNTDLTMGRQQIADTITLMLECEDVEQCTLHDAGVSGAKTGLLAFPARETRDNAAVVMTLDFASPSTVAGDFGPILDDTTVVNDVEATRPGGSSGFASAPVSIAAVGRYSAQPSRNTFDDTFLRHLAGRLVLMGTVAGMRVPSIGWNLRGTPSLAQQWLACSLGSKIRVLHPPSQYLPDPINVFLEGYTETIEGEQWDVVANVSIADANRIFVLATDTGDVGEFLGHLDWDTCVIHQATVTTTATSFTVDTTPLMTTVADDFPFDILVGFERMTVTNCVGASNPQTLTVTRSVNTVVAAHVVNEVVTLHPESACYLDL